MPENLIIPTVMGFNLLYYWVLYEWEVLRKILRIRERERFFCYRTNFLFLNIVIKSVGGEGCFFMHVNTEGHWTDYLKG